MVYFERGVEWQKMVENERRSSKSLEFWQYSENNPLLLLNFSCMMVEAHPNQFKFDLNPFMVEPTPQSSFSRS